jgi:putative DNA primase/helicase
MGTQPPDKPDKEKVIRFPNKQGKALGLSKPEPWEDDVIGSEVVAEIEAAIRRYVVLSESAVVTVTLWVILTHCFLNFTITPILAILSPEKQCGKTTLLDVIACFVCKPLLASSLTAATVFRVVEKERPTLLIDEADTFIRKDEALRGVLNSGNRASGCVLRTVGEDYEVSSFSTYCPKAIALIGNLPDTLQDRSVCIRLRRRTRHEKVSRFLTNKATELETVRRKIARWVDSYSIELKNIEPFLPDYLSNRSADNWLPLFAVADVIGNGWGARAREAARDITARNEKEVTAIGTLLLGDIKKLFNDCQMDRMSSSEIAVKLCTLDERPWAEWRRGKELSTNQLAYLLRSFSIFSSTMRLGKLGLQAKGYLRSQFEEAWEHYLPAEDTPESDGKTA